MTMCLRVKRVDAFKNDSSLNSGGLYRQTTIADVPTETLLQIFSYLSHGELMTAVPAVCRRWHQLHRDPSLYRRLDFTAFDPATTTAAVALLTAASWLKSLRVAHRTDANELLRRVKASNRHLETLIMHECHGTAVRHNVSSTCLRNVLRKCTRLQHLSLKGTRCCGRLFYTEIGLKLPALRAVNFGPTKYVTSAALSNMADHCVHVEELRVFNLTEKIDHAQISSEVLGKLCARLYHCLRVVKMNCAACTDVAVKALARCRHLSKLHLYNAKLVTDEGIWLLSTMPNLVCLTVSQADLVSVEGWYRFFDTAVARRFRKLSLLMCDTIDDGVAIVIATNLQCLMVLWLVGCNHVSPLGHDVVRQLLPYSCRYVW